MGAAAVAAAIVATVAVAVPTEAAPIPRPGGRPGGGPLLLPTMTTATRGEPPEILKTLVDNHRRFLGFLEKRVGSRDIAEDILQDGFVRALERSADVRQEGSIVSWFYRLLRNAVTDHFRHQGAESRAMDRAAGLEETSSAIDDPELNETVCACVLGLLDTLKPEYARVLREVELNDRSLSDYASDAGITAGNAAVRVHRAREALRKQVIRCCGTCVEHGCEDCSCR
jgi:RNA polymerase sigma factor (sigma-70 family)